MTLKVLKCPITHWTPAFIKKSQDKELRDHYKELPVVFGREGHYYNSSTGVCWFEFKGKAYESGVDDFKFELRIIEATELNNKQCQAVLDAVAQLSMPKVYVQLAQDINFNSDMRAKTLDMFKWRKKTRLELSIRRVSPNE